MFLPISFARAKEVGERKRAKGLAPWIPSAATALNAAAGGLVCLNETSDRQKSGGRIAEGKRTGCFGLRVIADGLLPLNFTIKIRRRRISAHFKMISPYNLLMGNVQILTI